jgi:Uma2 family endonuclease
MERQAISVEEFDKWVNLPANVARNYEFISGEIVEVVSNPNSSSLGIVIGAYIALFVREHKLGHPTGADGGYQVGGERYIPDVGYISFERMPKLLSEDGYVPAAPDLAVEVLSPTDTTSQMTVKLGNYLAENTTVWIVDPQKEQIAVYVPNEKVKIFKKTDTLDGGKVLQDFKLPLQNIFT